MEQNICQSWLLVNLFTGKTWEEFLKAGGDVSDFGNRMEIIQKISIGDYLICYLTGVSRLSEYLKSLRNKTRPYWSGEVFPAESASSVALRPENSIPIHEG
jgi:hypothetical protein